MGLSDTRYSIAHVIQTSNTHGFCTSLYLLGWVGLGWAGLCCCFGEEMEKGRAGKKKKGCLGRDMYGNL